MLEVTCVCVWGGVLRLNVWHNKGRKQHIGLFKVPAVCLCVCVCVCVCVCECVWWVGGWLSRWGCRVFERVPWTSSFVAVFLPVSFSLTSCQLTQPENLDLVNIYATASAHTHTHTHTHTRTHTTTHTKMYRHAFNTKTHLCATKKLNWGQTTQHFTRSCDWKCVKTLNKKGNAEKELPKKSATKGGRDNRKRPERTWRRRDEKPGEEERPGERATERTKSGAEERDKDGWRGGKWDRELEEGGREIKIAERREIRQRLFPQDVVTTTTNELERQHPSPLVLCDTCKCVCVRVCVCVFQ